MLISRSNENIKTETYFSFYSGSDGDDGPIEEDPERILFVERFLNASVKSLIESDSADSTLLHSFVREINNESANLKELLNKFSAVEQVTILTAEESNKNRSTILHILASNSASHEVLSEILDTFLHENQPKTKKILMQKDSKGETILHILSKKAREGASLSTLQHVIQFYGNYLLKNIIESQTQTNPLNLAIVAGNTEGAKILMQNEYFLASGLNALQSSIKYTNPELVRFILDNNPDLRNQLDKKNSSPLHLVASLPWLSEEASSEVKQMRQDILKQLLEKNLSDVNQLNSQEENCVHVAISSGFVDAAMMIITHLQEFGDKELNRKKSVTKKKKNAGMSIRIETNL